jgi:hypothetical protein
MRISAIEKEVEKEVKRRLAAPARLTASLKSAWKRNEPSVRRNFIAGVKQTFPSLKGQFYVSKLSYEDRYASPPGTHYAIFQVLGNNQSLSWQGGYILHIGYERVQIKTDQELKNWVTYYIVSCKKPTEV